MWVILTILGIITIGLGIFSLIRGESIGFNIITIGAIFLGSGAIVSAVDTLRESLTKKN